MAHYHKLNTGVSSNSKKFWISVIKVSCVDLAAAKHEGSVDNEYLLVDEGKMVNGSFCNFGKYVRSAMLSNQESSSDSTISPSANVLLDKASGPLWRSAGTCTRAKSNIKMP